MQAEKFFPVMDHLVISDTQYNMEKRFVSIWFRHLTTDWHCLRQPELHSMPFVLRSSYHGKMIISAANAMAMKHGIVKDMVLADARAIVPDLQVRDDRPDLPGKLLKRLAEWSIRFTPAPSVDIPDGILLDATGCSHLWGGEQMYIQTIVKKLSDRGYDITAAMADTPGVAWAVARYGSDNFSGRSTIIPPGKHSEALLPLPVEALRLEPDAIERLHKLGLHRFGQIITMPRASLRRRFGPQILNRLDLAAGREEEIIQPVIPAEQYQERLPCLEPIVTASGIEITLDQLLRKLCKRLRDEHKGLRHAHFKAYRVDGKMEQVEIGTSRPTHHVAHLSKLFELKLCCIEPALGIELFILEASKVEEHLDAQSKLWETSGGLHDERLSELIDKLAVKTGVQPVRYFQDEHYWPERSVRAESSLQKKKHYRMAHRPD